MNKLVLICLLFVVPTAFSANVGTTASPDCGNPLLSVFEFTKLDAPTAQTGLSFCKSLEGKSLCCSAATINSIQDPIDSLVTEIIQKAALRDKWLLSLRTDTTTGLPSFSTDLATLQTNALAALAIVNGVNGLTATPTPTGTTLTRLNALKDGITPYSTLSSTVNDKVDTNWDSYQTTRATCMNALIEAQASVLCLACTSNYNSIGVDTDPEADELVAWSSDFEDSISAACAPFVTQAQTQNALTTAYTYRKVLATFATSLATITGGDTGTITKDATTFAAISTGFTPESLTTDYQEPLATITSTACTTSDCPFAYTTLWTQNAVLNDDYAANGGQITVSDSSSRLLADSRTLTASANTYDPSSSANAAGVTVDFPEDAIAAASGFRQGGLMTCLVALIAVFLF